MWHVIFCRSARVGLAIAVCAGLGLTQDGCSGGAHSSGDGAARDGRPDLGSSDGATPRADVGDAADTGSANDGEALADAGAEAAVEGGSDTLVGTGLDAPAETGLDAPADSPVDANAEVGADTGPEAADRPPSDAAPEVGNKSLGRPCTAGAECASGQCVDSTCCSQPSCPQCQACGTAGACLPVPRGMDDTVGATCSGTSTCDGTGVCKKKLGQGCGGDLECAHGFCSALVCAAPSCSALPATCGPSADEVCCKQAPVPGGTYNRSNDARYPATVSGFLLDRFEVTVGRFRQFMEAGKGTTAAGSFPLPGEGAHPLIPNSGWDSNWTSNLTDSTGALRAALKCVGTNWTDNPGAFETQPMNCATWYEAFAFCAWDGGWLPTEAEWNYAAAGGNEQRNYPWGNAAPDDTYAVYFPGSIINNAVMTRTVGSKSPKGDGKWGQADLAGNVSEWNIDWYKNPYPLPCVDCVELPNATSKIIRGGSHQIASSALANSARGTVGPTGRGDHIGFRCGRTP